MNPVRRDDVICREEEFGAIIFDPQAGRMHKVNVTGLVIWNMCDGSTDTDTIVQKTAEHEGESAESMKPAVDAFLKDMTDRQLIRWQ